MFDSYKYRAKYNHFRIKLTDNTWIEIYYLPYMIFKYRWNEWEKKLRVFGFGASYNKVPF